MFTSQKQKKKPPPRPPPPKLTVYKSKSTYNLNHQSQTEDLINWSPPNSPRPEARRNFGGSVSSSFSSSTSSLASSKKSLELENSQFNFWPPPPQVSVNKTSESSSSFQSYMAPESNKPGNFGNNLVPQLFGPTIIRPKVEPGFNRVEVNSTESAPDSPPMPKIPPPSPPKDVIDVEHSYGIALFDFPVTHPGDLALQKDDVVVLLRRINNEWLYGKNLNKEGMFPENFIDTVVPLKNEENIVTAIYNFEAQMPGDLSFKSGQKIKVSRIVSPEWLFGEYEGRSGQFPSNFVNRIPKSI